MMDESYSLHFQQNGFDSSFSAGWQTAINYKIKSDTQSKIILMLNHNEIFVFRASEGQKSENNFDSQVVQYEPAHKGSINTVTKLSPDLCVSGGSDQVNSSGFKRHVINKQV